MDIDNYQNNSAIFNNVRQTGFPALCKYGCPLNLFILQTKVLYNWHHCPFANIFIINLIRASVLPTSTGVFVLNENMYTCAMYKYMYAYMYEHAKMLYIMPKTKSIEHLHTCRLFKNKSRTGFPKKILYSWFFIITKNYVKLICTQYFLSDLITV